MQWVDVGVSEGRLGLTHLLVIFESSRVLNREFTRRGRQMWTHNDDDLDLVLSQPGHSSSPLCWYFYVGNNAAYMQFYMHDVWLVHLQDRLMDLVSDYVVHTFQSSDMLLTGASLPACVC